MFEILTKKILSDKIIEINVACPEIAAKAEPGQFVVIRIHARGERIPLTIADFDPQAGWITLVYQMVGKSTVQLSGWEVGDTLASVTGPLGHATIIENYGTVVCIGGGVGIAPVYPIARALKNAGNRVISIIGARDKNLLFWEKKMAGISDQLLICTDDGSYGQKALVTQPLEEILSGSEEDVKKVWAIGPGIMMKFCSLTAAKYKKPVIVSLNTIMVDGTGMCGGCRVNLKDKSYFACVDGPEFDGSEVDWDVLLSRQGQFKQEEVIANAAYEKCKCLSASGA